MFFQHLVIAADNFGSGLAIALGGSYSTSVFIGRVFLFSENPPLLSWSHRIFVLVSSTDFVIDAKKSAP